jgi:hypothetical protein
LQDLPFAPILTCPTTWCAAQPHFSRRAWKESTSTDTGDFAGGDGSFAGSAIAPGIGGHGRRDFPHGPADRLLMDADLGFQDPDAETVPRGIRQPVPGHQGVYDVTRAVAVPAGQGALAHRRPRPCRCRIEYPPTRATWYSASR